MQKLVKDFVILGHQDFDKVIDGREIVVYQAYENKHMQISYKEILRTHNSLAAFLELLEHHNATVLKYIGNKESVMFFIK